MTTAHADTESIRSSFTHRSWMPNRQYTQVGKYTVGPTIGQGEFGRVKLCWKDENGVRRQFAMKLMREDKIKGDKSQEMKVAHEIRALKGCKHPNIIRLEEVFKFRRYIAIVLEYASGGDMFTHIFNNGKLNEKQAQKMFAQLVSGVSYLHSKGIAHRDLKLENLLLDSNQSIQISDFGFANQFKAERGMSRMMKTACGSPCYAAPEVVNSHRDYDGRKADVWSVGVILFTYLAGYLPFDDDPQNPDSEDVQKLYQYIARTPLKFPDWIGMEARDLLRRILVVDPEKRMSMHEIKSHSWLIDHNQFLSVTPAEHEGSAFWQRQASTREQPNQSLQSAGPSTRHGVRQSAHVVPSIQQPTPVAHSGIGRTFSASSGISAISTASSGGNAAAPTTSSGGVSIPRSSSTASRYSPNHASARISAHVPSAHVGGHNRSLSTAAAAAAMPNRKPVAAAARPHIPVHDRRQSAMPTFSNFSTNESHKYNEDVVPELGIANPPMQSHSSPQRLQQPVKPRPISFQPLSSGAKLDGLYAPSSSQPRVALNRESSKSGEMSKPVYNVSRSPRADESMSGNTTNGPSGHHRTSSTQSQKQTIQLVSDLKRHSHAPSSITGVTQSSGPLNVPDAKPTGGSQIPRSASTATARSSLTPPTALSPTIGSPTPMSPTMELPQDLLTDPGVKEMAPPVRRTSVRNQGQAQIEREDTRTYHKSQPSASQTPRAQSQHQQHQQHSQSMNQSFYPTERRSSARPARTTNTHQRQHSQLPTSVEEQPTQPVRKSAKETSAQPAYPDLRPHSTSSGNDTSKSEIPQSRSRFRLSSMMWPKAKTADVGDQSTRSDRRASYISVASSKPSSAANQSSAQHRQSGIPVKARNEKEGGGGIKKTLNNIFRRSMVG